MQEFCFGNCPNPNTDSSLKNNYGPPIRDRAVAKVGIQKKFEKQTEIVSHRNKITQASNSGKKYHCTEGQIRYFYYQETQKIKPKKLFTLRAIARPPPRSKNLFPSQFPHHIIATSAAPERGRGKKPLWRPKWAKGSVYVLVFTLLYLGILRDPIRNHEED